MTVIALAISNRPVLEIAIASLVADRTIKRVIDEEEFHHALPRLLDHWTVRADFLSISRRECAAGLRFGWPRLHFNETNAAIARDGQPLMIEEARTFLSRQPPFLKQGRARGDLQFPPHPR